MTTANEDSWNHDDPSNRINLALAGRCPLCGAHLVESRCYECKLCGVCGTRWEGASCPNCFPVTPAYAPSDSSSVEGEAALQKRETSDLLGGRPISLTEYRYLSSLSFDRKRAEIHEMVENAVSAWAIPPAASTRITQNITLRITKEIRRGLSKAEVKPLLASLLQEEAAGLGRGMEEVNRALAAVGLRQAPHWLVIASPSSFKVCVGGSERSAKSSEMKKKEQWSSWLEMRGYPSDARIVNVRVPIYLSDAGLTEIKVEGAVILEYSKKRRATLIDPSTLRINVDNARSFYAWKSMKKVRLDDDIAPQRMELDRTSYAKKFMLGNGKFPASTELATVAGCARKINALFLRKFKEKRNDQGRPWKTVALEALRETDEAEVFPSIPRVKRGRILLRLKNMNLTKHDLDYTGVRGVLVLSEFED